MLIVHPVAARVKKPVGVASCDQAAKPPEQQRKRPSDLPPQRADSLTDMWSPSAKACGWSEFDLKHDGRPEVSLERGAGVYSEPLCHGDIGFGALPQNKFRTCVFFRRVIFLRIASGDPFFVFPGTARSCFETAVKSFAVILSIASAPRHWLSGSAAIDSLDC
jgi:hypothetical protein